MTITKQYLRSHPKHIFVFGDNNLRKGCKGAAALRYEQNTYGFITKKVPSFSGSSYYKPIEYKDIFNFQIKKLLSYIEGNLDKTFLISKLGSGLANKYHIWEKIIKPGISILHEYGNVIFLWEDNKIYFT